MSRRCAPFHIAVVQKQNIGELLLFVSCREVMEGKMRQIFRGPFFGLLLWVIFASTSWSQGGGAWETRVPMPVYRQELATGVLSGKLYVLGGYGQFGSPTATVEVYNPVTNTWTFAHSLPYAVDHNAAAVAGGKLYSFGAGGGETFVYDPNRNSWAARPPAIMCTVELRRSE
jgi:Kelch motif